MIGVAWSTAAPQIPTVERVLQGSRRGSPHRQRRENDAGVFSPLPMGSGRPTTPHRHGSGTSGALWRGRDVPERSEGSTQGVASLLGLFAGVGGSPRTMRRRECVDASDFIAGVGGSPRTMRRRECVDASDFIAGVGGSPRTMPRCFVIEASD